MSKEDTRETVDKRMAVSLVAITMLFTGASGLIMEFILSTIATYVLGNSIEQFSVTIGTMMLMMGIGGWLQRFVDDSMLIEKFIGVEIVLAVVGGFAPLATYAAFGLIPDHFPLVQYWFVIVIGLLIGFEIPLVARINAVYQEKLKSNLATVFGMDYVGSFLGVIVWVYCLLKYFPLTEISFMVVGLNLTVAIVAFFYFMRHGLVSAPRRVIVAGSVAIALLGYGASHNRDWSSLMEQKFYEDPIVFSQTTKYQHIVITHDPKLDEHRLYLNGNLQFSSLDEHRYHESLVYPVMTLAPQHKNVLVLGGGDGLALRRILQYGDVESVTLVDLDPMMIELASADPVISKLNGHAFADARVLVRNSSGVTRGHLKSLYNDTGEIDDRGHPKTERMATVNVVNVDADRFLDDVPGQWDVIIVDFPDPNAVELTKLYSKEFYMKLKRVLSPRGMVVVQSTSPYHAKEAFLCIQRTMRAAGWGTLPYHDNIPSFGDWGWIMAWNENQYVQGEVSDAASRIVSFGVDTQYLTPQLFRASLVFGKDGLIA